MKPTIPAPRKGSKESKEVATAELNKDDCRDDSSLHKLSSSDSDSSSKSVVISKKRKAKPSSPAAEKLKLSSVESSEDLDNSANLVAEKLLDDSFNNLLPVSNMKLGRYVIKNYENKDKSMSISPPTHAMKSTNKDCVVTTLNGKIAFISLGEKARQKHDVKSFGIKPPALHPRQNLPFKYFCPQ